MVKLSKAVEDSTRFVTVGTAIATAVMLVVFFILHLATDVVPFNIEVIVSAILGWAVASLNFFLMAISAEKAASDDNYDNARRRMTVSYRYRTLMQLAFVVIVILVPFLNWVAGIIPLFLPSILIKGKGILDGRKTNSSDSSEKEEIDSTEKEEIASEESKKEEE